MSDTRQGLLMGELPPHLSIHRKISIPPLLCAVQTLLKNQTDSGFTSPTKRQTINRQLFHRPAAFILFRFTIQIGGKASYVKLCLHWSCNLHPMFCVSRPLPQFGRVIRIQSASDDFVPGTVPLRPKNAGDEVPLIFLYPVRCPENI